MFFTSLKRALLNQMTISPITYSVGRSFCTQATEDMAEDHNQSRAYFKFVLIKCLQRQNKRFEFGRS